MIFDRYSQKIFYKITDRFGGVSKAPYNMLNLALHVGDDPIDVLKNRLILSKESNFYIDNLIYMEQTHSSNIQVIKDSSINCIKNCDGLITNVKNIPLMVMVADCIPILIFDPLKSVIAVVHAGRNGTFKEIAKETILRMVSEFDSKPKDILVYFGPSIGSCCYEVGKEIVDIVKKSFKMDYIKIRDKKFYLDVASLNIDQLLNIGVKRDHIEISSICTCCSMDYFSYRRDGSTGRFAGILKICE